MEYERKFVLMAYILEGRTSVGTPQCVLRKSYNILMRYFSLALLKNFRTFVPLNACVVHCLCSTPVFTKCVAFELSVFSVDNPCLSPIFIHLFEKFL
jgi:hypothetical protein